MIPRAVLLPALLLVGCTADPATVAPDGGDTIVAAATQAAVDDTDAALREAGTQGTK